MLQFGNSCVCFVLLVIFQAFAQQRDIIVNVETGSVRGKLMRTITRQYSAFLGIPFASPPARFEFPQRPLAWRGVRDTITFKPVCPQMDYRLGRVVGNEDCLYLNVYTPSENPGQMIGFRTYPVIVFIHGQDYQSGTGNIYGEQIFIDKDTVVVTLNYRTGVLGFLSTGDNALPGNLALHDQNMALRWIKRNIGSFHGDNSRVTLVGQGAGGAMVSLHMVSPLSKGLFDRAITESGNGLCDWAVDEKPKDNSAEYAQKLARYLECGTGYIQPSFLIKCIKTRLITDIISGQEKFQGFGSFPGVWKPVVDAYQTNQSRVFLSDSPKQLMLRNEITGSDLITGINKDEGSYLYSYLLKYMPNIAIDRRLVEEELIPNFLGNLTSLYGPVVIERIVNRYFTSINSRKLAELMKAFTEMATDALFVGCNNNWAKGHAKSRVILSNNSPTTSKTYMYVFTYKGSRSFVDKQPGVFGVSKLFDTGVSYGDELIYLWKMQLFNSTRLSLFDQAVSERMAFLWSNFAQNGNPVRYIFPGLNPWREIQLNANSYYEIGRDTRLSNSYRQMESRLWTEDLPAVSIIRTTSVYPTVEVVTSSANFAGKSVEPYKTAAWAMLAIIIALIILAIFLCCLLIASKRKREFKAEHDVYH